MGKLSSKIYKANSEAYKVARTLSDIEDLSQGKVDKVVKRHARRTVRKEVNKTLNKFFKKIGL